MRENTDQKNSKYGHFHAVYGPGKVCEYWMKGRNSLHEKMQLDLNECLERESSETPAWMTERKICLILNDGKKGDQLVISFF